MCNVNDFCVHVEMLVGGAGNIGLRFKNARGDTLRVFYDVTTDISWAREFCDRCNFASLSEAHILDVLEDSLG